MLKTPDATFDALESRQMLNAAFDLIGLSQLRADPAYAGLDGSGVTVAVLDTGLDRTHIKLASNYVAGRNIVSGTDDPVDREAHGTHVAGIIGSSDPEIGVAPAAGLVGVKVLGDNGSGTFTDIRDGLRWVYDNRTRYNIQVVNMSLGGGFYTSISQVSGDIILPEIRRLEAAGITVVSAGGNSFKNHEYQNYGAPGVYSTLVVGATWKDGSQRDVRWGDGAIDFTTGAGRITSFSQRMVASNTIFAPGAFMRSTVPGNRYDNMGGTSQASPVVAGAVAILQEAAKQFGGRSLSPAEVRDVLTSTAVTIFDGDDEDDNVTNTRVSYPRLDIYAAVREVRSRLTGSAPAPEPGGNAADANGTITGAFLMNPSLDGSEALSASGRIGVDFGTTQVGASDVDMFKFSTASAGVVTIQVASNQTTPEDFDSFLRLFNASGGVLASNDDSGGTGFSRISIALQPGTYYVGLSGAGNSSYDPAGSSGRTAGATGTYTISFSLSNSDPNGLFSGAVEVSFGTDLAPTTFAGLIGRDYGALVGTSDVDMYKVVAPDDGVLIVDIDSPDASGYVDSYLRIFDEAGVQLAFDDDSEAPDETAVGSIVYDTASGDPVGHTTDSYRTITITRGQTYYVAISDYDNRSYDPTTLTGRATTGTGGVYDIFIKFRSVDADGSITSAAAYPALLFPFSNIEAAIGSDGGETVGNKDVDFYRFTVTKASLLEIEVNSAIDGPAGGTPFDAVIYLYDSNGNLLASNDDFESTDPVLQFVVQPRTTYYVAVAGFGNDNFDPFAAGSGTPGEMGDYILAGRLFATSAVKTISDDAIGFSRIQTVTSGSNLRSTLGEDSSFNSGTGDVDLFKFIAADDGILTVNADGYEQFSADTFLRLFDSSGKEMAFNDNRSDETRGSTVAGAVKKGKVYYIGVSGASASARLYSPKKFGNAVVGSTGSYALSVAYNQVPTLTAVTNLSMADAGVPYTITHAALLGAANEVDPEGANLSFVVSKVTGGTLTKNGVAVVANVTSIAPGEELVWTPTTKMSGVVKAFTIVASDGVQRSIKPVQVSVVVNQAPTLTTVKDFTVPVGATEISIPFASLLAAANEADKNKDAITFRIDSVLSGELLINGSAVTGGSTLVSSGDTLVYRQATGATGRFSAFTIRAFDGRLNSLVATPVRVKIS
jgi:hypothetical protein